MGEATAEASANANATTQVKKSETAEVGSTAEHTINKDFIVGDDISEKVFKGLGDEKAKATATAVATAKAAAAASAKAYAKKQLTYKVSAQATGHAWGDGEVKKSGVSEGKACVDVNYVKEILEMSKDHQLDSDDTAKIVAEGDKA